MKMKNLSLKVVSCALVFIMALGISPITTFAYEDTAATSISHDLGVMQPNVDVYPIGTHSYYKTDGEGILFADKIEDGYEPVPSHYINGSPYNDGQTYGIYVTADGKVHFVSLDECELVNGHYKYVHGTSDGATISREEDSTKEGDNEIGTQFFINIEDGMDFDGLITETNVTSNSTDPRVSYKIVVAQKETYQIKATVPMYVCMYGFRGTGNIITPSEDAYGILNYSTKKYGTEKSIQEIVMSVKMAQIYDENHSNEKLYAIAYKEGEGYTYWYSEPEAEITGFDSYHILTDQNINASGEWYVIYLSQINMWCFTPSGSLDGDVFSETVDKISEMFPLESDFTDGNVNFGTVFSVGDSAKNENAGTEGLPLQVTGIQGVPETWTLKAADEQDLDKGELIMKIKPGAALYNDSALDLASCSAKTDITDRGWFIAAPTVQYGTVKTPAELSLLVSARMAGSNLNDAGCTPVVRVNYTLTPIATQNFPSDGPN